MMIRKSNRDGRLRRKSRKPSKKEDGITTRNSMMREPCMERQKKNANKDGKKRKSMLRKLLLERQINLNIVISKISEATG